MTVSDMISDGEITVNRSNNSIDTSAKGNGSKKDKIDVPENKNDEKMVYQENQKETTLSSALVHYGQFARNCSYAYQV